MKLLIKSSKLICCVESCVVQALVATFGGRLVQMFSNNVLNMSGDLALTTVFSKWFYSMARIIMFSR